MNNIAKSYETVPNLPYPTWYIDKEDSETFVNRVDVDSSTPGDQQIIEVKQGSTITIEVEIQVWCSGGPSIIKQVFATYSWNEIWPPDDYYTLHDGGTDYYPGLTFTKKFDVQVPYLTGEYGLWFCNEAHYSMEEALSNFVEEPSMPPHAIINVIPNSEVHYQDVWNVNMNGQGDSITVSPGESIDISMDYQIWNRIGCPSCIAQIVIGLGTTPYYCAYNGIPGIYPGVTSSNTHKITAPNTPGIYELKFCGHRCYSCSQASSEYTNPERQKSIIGIITVDEEEEDFVDIEVIEDSVIIDDKTPSIGQEVKIKFDIKNSGNTASKADYYAGDKLYFVDLSFWDIKDVGGDSAWTLSGKYNKYEVNHYEDLETNELVEELAPGETKTISLSFTIENDLFRSSALFTDEIIVTVDYKSDDIDYENNIGILDEISLIPEPSSGLSCIMAALTAAKPELGLLPKNSLIFTEFDLITVNILNDLDDGDIWNLGYDIADFAAFLKNNLGGSFFSYLWTLYRGGMDCAEILVYIIISLSRLQSEYDINIWEGMNYFARLSTFNIFQFIEVAIQLGVLSKEGVYSNIYCPVEAYFENEEGLISGYLNGKIRNEIPGSQVNYSNEHIHIFLSSYNKSITFNAIGIDKGTADIEFAFFNNSSDFSYLNFDSLNVTTGCKLTKNLNQLFLKQNLNYSKEDDGFVDLQLYANLTFIKPISSFIYEYVESPNEFTVLFDASSSYDPDGIITNYYWDFGDGNESTGITTSHVYTETGNYMISLTVIDNVGATDKDERIISIGKYNTAPCKPMISGTTKCSTNFTYFYSIVSSDKENDNIQYYIDWGDGCSNISHFNTNNKPVNFSHIWNQQGVYEIKVYCKDEENAISTVNSLIVLIDVKVEYIDDMIEGYLLDKDNDDIFELFHNNVTEMETEIGEQTDGSYLIDYDDDGSWDYTYNSVSGLKKYKKQDNDPLGGLKNIPGFNLLIVILALLTIMYINRKLKNR